MTSILPKRPGYCFALDVMMPSQQPNQTDIHSCSSTAAFARWQNASAAGSS
jgi:hypothetical protein